VGVLLILGSAVDRHNFWRVHRHNSAVVGFSFGRWNLFPAIRVGRVNSLSGDYCVASTERTYPISENFVP